MATSVPAIQGLRGSGQFDLDHRPTNYRQLYTLLEPNGNAPLNAMLAMASSESTNDPKYNNFRDELPDRVLTVGGAYTDDTGTTAIDLVDSDENPFAVKGAVVINATTQEVMHVTVDTPAGTGAAVTVIRNIGGAGGLVSSGDKLFIAGFAARSGDALSTAITWDAEVASNQTQIFRTPFSLTGSLDNTYLRTGNKMDEMTVKALKLHMSDIERSMFFGKQYTLNENTAQETRFTGGILNEITGITDVASDFAAADTMTEEEFDKLLFETIFAYGTKQKLVFCGANAAHQLQAFGKDRWQPTMVEGTYGVNFTRYATYAGDLLVHLHPQFRQIPEMTNAMVLVDFPYLVHRYLDSRDTDILYARQNPGDDAETNEYLTECGLELLQDKPHHYIKNWVRRA